MIAPNNSNYFNHDNNRTGGITVGSLLSNISTATSPKNAEEHEFPAAETGVASAT